MAETTRGPTFLWQAMLILLPVLVLLVAGLNSLRQDKILARRDAAERAHRLGDELLSAGASTLISPRETIEPPSPLFQVDPSGQLVSPPPVMQVGPKPLLPDALTPEQAELWRTARKCEAQPNGSAEAIKAYSELIALHPPPSFVANATYSLGLLHAARGEAAAAAQQFNRLIENQPEAVSESGLPLWPMACLKLLESQPKLPQAERVGLVQSFCSNVVYRPIPLTAALLRNAARWAPDPAAKATLEQWTRLWQQHEGERALYAAAKDHFTNDAVAFWFSFDESETLPSQAGKGPASGRTSQAGRPWLAVPCQEMPAGRWFRCWPEPQAAAELKTTLNRTAAELDYFGVELRVCGKAIVWLGASSAERGAGQHEGGPELLAVVRRSGNGVEWLEASVFLAQPSLLYAHQQTRRLWFGLLIGISAAAALIGLGASWRAFQRQQRLGELKSNFVSSVSHELRTPVAAVQLLVEGLETGKVSGPWKQREYLRLIRQECRRLSSLIENILDVSRIEQGRMEFHFEPTDVAALVDQTVKIIEPYAVERQVSLSVLAPSFAPDHSRLLPLLDRGSIEQALLNLIDNAIKHSPEGETVTVGLEVHSPPSTVHSPQATVNSPQAAGSKNASRFAHHVSRVHLWVEDHGGGIPPEEHERIFERFYRRGSELRRETQGVGIGLSIVQHVAEGHGGKVLVRSAVGQGSRFTIVLPMNFPPQDSHEHR